MKIYKCDPYFSDESSFNHLEFVKNIIEEFKGFSKRIYIAHPESGDWDIGDYPSFLFSSLKEAICYISNADYICGGRVSEYEISRDQELELIFKTQLSAVIDPIQVWYYYFNSDKAKMEEFKLKAFL